MIFIAVPGDSRCGAGWPGRDLPDHRQADRRVRARPSATSAARTAYPSIAELSNRGRLMRRDDVLADAQIQGVQHVLAERRQLLDAAQQVLAGARPSSAGRCGPGSGGGGSGLRSPAIAAGSSVFLRPNKGMRNTVVRRLRQVRFMLAGAAACRLVQRPLREPDGASRPAACRPSSGPLAHPDHTLGQRDRLGAEVGDAVPATRPDEVQHIGLSVGTHSRGSAVCSWRRTRSASR